MKYGLKWGNLWLVSYRDSWAAPIYRYEPCYHDYDFTLNACVRMNDRGFDVLGIEDEEGNDCKDHFRVVRLLHEG